MLEIRNVHKTFNLGTINEKHALNGVDLKLDEGDFVTVIGGNGAGKSTMLNAVAGTWPVDEGSILIDGVDVTGLPEFKRATFLGRVFQDPMTGTTATMQIDENLALAARRGQKRGLRWGITKAEKEQFHELLKELDLGLEDRMTSKVGLLSGGQRQAVTLLMASLQKPKVLLLDEPLAALDLKLRKEMQYELIRLKNELGITFIYVTHDQEEALTMSDTIVVMNQGYIQQIGTPESIYNEPENAFVADFIGDSNIIDSVMIRDKLVSFLGKKWDCVDTGFGENKPVDVVIRPEDVILKEEGAGTLDGVVSHLIFKGVHYEMEVMAGGFEWLVHSTSMFPVGTKISISVDPFNIQIMNKPESNDEKAVEINE